MKVVRPGFKIEGEVNGPEILKRIERYGRTCYKSEDKITDKSAPKFVRNIIKMGHESVIEHESITVRIICDRGVSHELVRHRIASYSQESTKYCDYAKSGEIQAIALPASEVSHSIVHADWFEAMEHAEWAYFRLRGRGVPPEIARGVLPNSLKTEIVITANLREWRHIFRLRAINPKAHPQMREIMLPLLAEFKSLIPVVFEDL